jgi:Zn-dependent protease with chaperone function/tellurite resistance protein
MAPRLDLRARGEADLETLLLADAGLKKAIETLEKQPDLGARRHLLSTSVRVTPAMSPKLDALLKECSTRLGVETQVETYVYPEASFNAGCVRPEQGRVFVMLSSALLEAFDDEELRFVVGHELGHHLFGHHRLPVRLLTGQATALPGPIVMQLFAWSRYAEISADRAGLVCAGGLEPVARSLFKLASGLRGGLVQMRSDDLLAQLGDIRTELGRQAEAQHEKPNGDWFATHPFSPLRLHAARHFAVAKAFRESGTLNDDQLEAEIADLMSLMEPRYLTEKTESAELMRRLLLAGGVAIAAASGEIDPKERAVLDKFFGVGTCASLNVAALQGDLANRAAAVKEKVNPLKAQQVIRDLCVIARADGHVEPGEKALLLRTAANAGVDAVFVERALTSENLLD